MEETLYGVAVVPVIIGLVEVAKDVGMPSRFAPILSIIFGFGAGYLVTGGDPAKTVVYGIAYGLAASGLYSGGKAVVKG